MLGRSNWLMAANINDTDTEAIDNQDNLTSVGNHGMLHDVRPVLYLPARPKLPLHCVLQRILLLLRIPPAPR